MLQVVGKVCRILITTSLLSTIAFAGDDPNSFRKSAVDILTRYTSVGNIGLTVTNFGTVGTRNAFWPSQPSCEYPRGSRIEHLSQGALWVGALFKADTTKHRNDPRNNQFLVSTGATDQPSSPGAIQDYEFNSEISDSILEYSSLTDNRPLTSQYSVLAISHQDLVCDYSDKYTRVPLTGDSIINHFPLGIKVHQESYAYNYPFSDFFVILRYLIVNASTDTLDSVYVGFWANPAVRNTNLVRPGTSGYFDHQGHGYDTTQRMAYSFDYDGIPSPPPADSYIGIKLLGCTPFPSGVDSLGNLNRHTYFNAWRFRSSTGEEVFYSPAFDGGSGYTSRYYRLSNSMPQSDVARLRVPPPSGVAPLSVTYLVSTGPFSRLSPGDSLEVVYAVVCAKKFGNDPARLDTDPQKKNLLSNIRWAQQAYNGEDVNGNNKLDPGEDIARRDSVSPTEYGLRYEPDGKITRYLLPTPPKQPKVHAEVKNQYSAIYWDKSSAEESIDPISDRKDFEGYRVYQSIVGNDFLNHSDFLLNLSLVGDFDRSDDSIGYNTGFHAILLDSAKTFPGDTVHYWYRFPPKDTVVHSLNGWQIIYGISAYDQGDAVNGVPSLESAKSIVRVIPGTPPTSNKSASIGVYPNPYFVNAYWDGARERQRKIYFYNLPARCEIRIYTLGGDVVTVLEHDAATYNGSGINWFNDFGDPSTKAQFAGGEHAWDLITRHDQAIATGLYLFTVEDKNTGEVKRGKFVVIK